MFSLTAVAIIMCAAVIYGHTPLCQTPDDKCGSCIPISDCNPLKTIFDKPNKTEQEVTFLNKSNCGSVGGQPKVCCPKQVGPAHTNSTILKCLTPDGETGECVSVCSCRHIANMFKPPISKEDLAFVKSSRCKGPEKYSVCCGPPPVAEEDTEGCPDKMTAFPPDPSSQCCGDSGEVTDKITGANGTGTGIDQYPWAVLIEYTNKIDRRTRLHCGGVLISGKYVLTAGHCIAGENLMEVVPRRVRLGEYDTSNDGKDCLFAPGGGMDCTDGVTRIDIETTIPHPDYAPGKSKRNDIGLIRLKKTAPLTDFIRPVCLPTRDLTRPENKPHKPLYVVGWGATEHQLLSNIKVHVDLPYVSPQECQPFYENSKDPLWRGQLCAGGKDNKDSCKGDSGGPLLYENENKLFELIGIVSFGRQPCGENIPGVYTNVYEYLPWIKDVIVA